MENVAARVDTLGVGLSVLIDARAVGNSVKRDIRALGKLVLGNKSAGEQERITFYVLTRLGNRLAALVNLCDGNAGNSVLAVYLDDGVAEHERNAEVVEALLDVSCETARIRHQLAHSFDLCALKRHSSCHNKSDISRAENYYLLTGHIAVHIYKSLRSSRGEDTRGASSADIERSFGALAASHSENDSLRLDHKHSVLGVHSGDYLIGRDVENHCVELEGDVSLSYLKLVAISVLGARELLLEAMESESVVYALTENAAKAGVTLENKNIAKSRVVSRNSRAHTCRAAAYDDEIDVNVFRHITYLPWSCRSL